VLAGGGEVLAAAYDTVEVTGGVTIGAGGALFAVDGDGTATCCVAAAAGVLAGCAGGFTGGEVAGAFAGCACAPVACAPVACAPVACAVVVAGSGWMSGVAVVVGVPVGTLGGAPDGAGAAGVGDALDGAGPTLADHRLAGVEDGAGGAAGDGGGGDGGVAIESTRTWNEAPSGSPA